MNLFEYSLLSSALLLSLGTVFLLRQPVLNEMVQKFPRSQKLSILLLALGLGWFLHRHVQNLSDADFGEYKVLIGGLASAVAVLSYLFVKDFLAVRALCILALFYSREVLDSAFLQEPSTRLFLVSLIYVVILLSLYLGAWPFRLRDFFGWLFDKPTRASGLGGLVFGCGLILLALSFSY
tara:strand:- start:78 stop:617 length:540 start_codon:yes stop_codon:yes gene_type:complete